MNLNVIQKINSLNTDIAALRKSSYVYGLIVNDYIVASTDDSAIYTASAINATADLNTCFVLFEPPQLDSENNSDGYIYLLVKHNGNFIFEFYGIKSQLNIAALKGSLEALYRENTPLVVLTNSEIEKEGSAVIISGFSFSTDVITQLVDIDLTQVVNLKSLRINKSFINKKLFIIIGLIFVVAFIFIISKEEPQQIKVVPTIVKKQVPYKSLKQFYTQNSIEAYTQLVNLYRQVNEVNSVNGWSVIGAYLTREDKSGDLVEILELQSSYGELKSIQNFISNNNYSVDIQNSKAVLSRTIQKESVFINYARFHVGSYQKWLSSSFNFFFDDVDIKTRDLKVDVVEKNVLFKQNTLTIPDLYFEDLISIAGNLRGKPYSLEEVKFIKTSSSNSFTLTLTLVISGVTDGN